MASLAMVVASAILTIFAYDVYDRDREARKPVEAFAARYTLSLRRPDVAESLRYAPSADFAADLIADASLRDATATARLSGLTPEQRMAWLDTVSNIDKQLSSAADLTLDALVQRPGWPYHAGLLGQVVYTHDAHVLSPAIVNQADRWRLPLRVATAAAPNDESLWQTTALAYLQTWPDLKDQHTDAGPIFQRAFQDVDFVRAAFPAATQIIGTDAAIDNLPNRPASLWAAFNQLVATHDLEHAWRVHQLWDAAEWTQRETDLIAIEKAASRRDVDVLRLLCETWTHDHSVWDYDSAAAHAQAARLLEAWPPSDNGRWASDERADVIRYFLSGRRTVDGALLARAADAVAGVPEPTRAQLRVLASDVRGAESIASHSDSFGSFEWKPYIFELSRYWLSRGDRARAEAALSKLPAAALEECEAIALAGRARPESPAVALTLTGRAAVPLCYTTASPAKLTIAGANGAAAIVDYGWDGARASSVYVPGDSSAVDAKLPAASGQHTVTLRVRPENVSVSVGVKPAS